MPKTLFGDEAVEPGRTIFGDTTEAETAQTSAAPSLTPQQQRFAESLESKGPIGAFLQGATFGFSDEAAAAIRSLVTRGLSFDEALQVVRGAEQRFREDSPKTAFGIEMAGGLTTGLAGGGRVLGAQALQRLPNVARFGAVGAGAGALAGAGTAEGGLSERALGAGQGAALGGAVGVVLPPIGRAAAAAITPLMREANAATRRALSRVQRGLARDEITPRQAAEELRTMGFNATLADIGENLRGAAESATMVPGTGRNVGRQFLVTRQAGQSQRLAETINRELGVTESFRQTLDDRLATRRVSARPLYEAAYAVDVPFTDELQSVFRRPAIGEAWREAQTIAGNEGVDLPLVFLRDAEGELTLNTAVAPTTQAIDFIKRGLDTIIEKARDPITREIVGDTARSVAKARGELLRIVDDLNEAYPAARAVYAGDSASIDALRGGRALGNSVAARRGQEQFDPEQILADLDKMGEGERAFFRQGLARGLIDVIEGSRDRADAVARITGTPMARRRIRAAFPDEASFNRFLLEFRNEAQMFETGARLLGGSPTVPRALGVADMVSDEAIAQLMQGNTGTATSSILGNIIRRARAPGEATAERLVNFTLDPEGSLSALARIAGLEETERLLGRVGVPALIEAERQAGASVNR